MEGKLLLWKLIHNADLILSDRDRESKKVLQFLFSKTLVPYTEMLRKWLFTGQVYDPYHEFMVVENASITKEQLRRDVNDMYWEQRFSLNDDCVPVFLESAKDKILTCGKYLNVIRECEISIPDREEMINVYQGRKPIDVLLTNDKAFDTDMYVSYA